MHDLSSCHSSKQTTILADIGVDWYHVAPATFTAYCMLRVYNEDAFDVSQDDIEQGVDESEIVLVNLP